MYRESELKLSKSSWLGRQTETSVTVLYDKCQRRLRPVGSGSCGSSACFSDAVTVRQAAAASLHSFFPSVASAPNYLFGRTMVHAHLCTLCFYLKNCVLSQLQNRAEQYFNYTCSQRNSVFYPHTCCSVGRDWPGTHGYRCCYQIVGRMFTILKSHNILYILKDSWGTTFSNDMFIGSGVTWHIFIVCLVDITLWTHCSAHCFLIQLTRRNYCFCWLWCFRFTTSLVSALTCCRHSSFYLLWNKWNVRRSLLYHDAKGGLGHFNQKSFNLLLKDAAPCDVTFPLLPLSKNRTSSWAPPTQHIVSLE